jgi:hypothetical protein
MREQEVHHRGQHEDEIEVYFVALLDAGVELNAEAALEDRRNGKNDEDADPRELPDVRTAASVLLLRF